jgi:hypothetical protein
MNDEPRERQKSAEAAPTAEVGGEGGSPGDVEIAPQDDPRTGSEADETSRPGAPRRDTR